MESILQMDCGHIWETLCTEDEISKYIKENPITDRRTQIIAETGVDPNSDSEDER